MMVMMAQDDDPAGGAAVPGRGGGGGERDEGGRGGRRRRSWTHLKELTGDDQRRSRRRLAALDKAADHHADGDAYAHAKHMRDAVIPKMADLRDARRQAGDDGGRRPVAAADLPRDAVHQVTTVTNSRSPP